MYKLPWLKLKGTAAKFCSANGKAIEQANPAVAPLQLGMVALLRFADTLAFQHVHVCGCVS